MWCIASILGCFAWGVGGGRLVVNEIDIFLSHWTKKTVSLNKPNSEF